MRPFSCTTILFQALSCALVVDSNIVLAQQLNDSLPSPSSAQELIDNAITALGGRDALEGLSSVQYEAAKTTMENYGMVGSDTVIATSGHQTVTFSYPNPGRSPILQRIDRHWQLSGEWIFASPYLDPRSFSLVVRGGDDGFACYTEGNNYVLSPPDEVQGYADAGLTNFLVLTATKMSPTLMLTILGDNATTSSTITVRDGVQMPAVTSPTTGITVIFDPTTSLPYIIRTVEQNALLGPSTRDLQLHNYTTTDGLRFPRRFTTTYQNAVTEDFSITRLTLNPPLPPSFFSGLPSPPPSSNNNNTTTTGTGSTTPEPPAPAQDSFTAAEIGVWSDNMLYAGAFAGTYENLRATHPAPGLDRVWRLVFEDYPLWTQLVVEFDGDGGDGGGGGGDGDDGGGSGAVFVFDAPPHQSELVLRWVREELGRSVTHVWPSHHHHDHTYGIRTFVDAGAQLVVPEVAAEFYSAIPGASVVSYSDANPFIHRDNQTQLRLIWHPEPPHAVDWGYAVVTGACPGADDPVVVFEADAWNVGFDVESADLYEVRGWLEQAVGDGLARGAIVAPAHGDVANLTELIDYLDFPYPDLATNDWRFGGPFC